MRFDPLPINRMTAEATCLLPPTEIEVPGCLTYTNIPDFGWDFGNHLLRTLYRPRICRLAAVGLRRFPPETRVAVPSGEELLPVCGGHVTAEHIHPSWPDERLQQALASCETIDFIDESAIIIGRFGMRTWGHWLGELLPKIMCVEAVHPGRYKYLLPAPLISDPVLRPQRESLEFYGLGRDRLLLVQPGRSYRFRELAAVTSVWSEHMIHPAAVELMRKYVKAPGEGVERPDRIALLRRESSTRNLANLDEIQWFLLAHGWSIVDIGELPFAEQVATFEAASAIVSVLGSGLAGLVYAPRGVKVLTLTPVDWADGFFFAMMQNRDATLADIRGLKSPDDPRRVADSRFRVKVEDIERGLRGLGLVRDRSGATLPTTELPAGSDADAKLKAATTREPDVPGGAEQNISPVQVHHPLTDEVSPDTQSGLISGQNNAEAFSRLGHALVKQGKLDAAADAFARAAYLRPHDVGLLIAQARALFATGRPEAASDAARRASDLDPRNMDVLRVVGDTSAHLGKVDEAVGAYKKALAIDPSDGEFLWKLAKLFQQNEQAETALGFIDRYITRYADRYEGYSERGHLLARLGEFERAAVAFQQALVRDPGNGGLREALAHTLGRIRRYHESLEPAITVRTQAGAEPIASRDIAKHTVMINVDVVHEAARIGDSLTVVPWLLALAERHSCTVCVSGQFNAGVMPLLGKLPIRFGPPEGGSCCATYVADVCASWDYAGPRGIHMCQGYFELAGMQAPTLPIDLDLAADATDLEPGVVISPFCGSEGADSPKHTRIWWPDRWRTVIQRLQTLDRGRRIYVLGGRGDDPTPYLCEGVTPLLARPLPEVLSLLRMSYLTISLDNGISHLAHFGGVDRHVLLYSEAVFATLMVNPRARTIRAWPRDISPGQVIECATRILDDTIEAR